MKPEYVKLILKKVDIKLEDLTPTELEIINFSFDLWNEKLQDLKILQDENKRIVIELLNLKAMLED